MVFLITCKLIHRFFRRSRAAYSAVNGGILPKFELIQALVDDLHVPRLGKKMAIFLLSITGSFVVSYRRVLSKSSSRYFILVFPGWAFQIIILPPNVNSTCTSKTCESH